MAVNKNALIRYKTIDKCLQNQLRHWTLNDLIEECSDALHEFENRQVNVSARTLQLDIQMMRSDKLGYNAPIEVYERKYYRYSIPDYSIANLPITTYDMDVLSETMSMLRQFQDFSLLKEFQGVFNKLEDRIHTQAASQQPIIHMDQNQNLKGLEYLDRLYRAIQKRTVLEVMYQSFKAIAPSVAVVHPWFLREYNNRWFLVGKNERSNNMITMALDRILGVDYDFTKDYQEPTVTSEEYYRNTIGVTVLNHSYIKNITFKVDAQNAPYVLTKPFHSSQQLKEKHDDGSMTFQMRVHHNFELERLLLGFGSAIEILSPQRLRRSIADKLRRAAGIYG